MGRLKVFEYGSFTNPDCDRIDAAIDVIVCRCIINQIFFQFLSSFS